ncbi:TPA: DUF2560 family protein [Serratia marcescens]|uniref:DUF2560 family protein n=1 Tax=Serratia marcescens TaxID=615 RepID=UPI001A28E12B|nr:DUF2560 family protein [Serratia marcescens]HAT3782063.1 DUF2560 family protein [Serratia marcescens]HAT3788028.1 DUF2560 family protein [Serratia marcescens]HAT3802116.1 DUF2560 family protein [Serratia marcescens]HAU5713910.1 DUF2560 family protein [Serratia marcescens]
MAEATEITQAESIRLKLLEIVGYDTAAAKQAIDFVKDSPIKADMFERQFRRFELESKDPIARTLKAIQESTEALILFNEPAA